MITPDGREIITICDVVKYKRHIEPFPLVKIYSGVGSGKSYFATSMIKGSKEYEIPKHNVLIITSRRAKVEETLKEMGVLVTNCIEKEGNLNFDVLVSGNVDWSEAEQYAKAIKYTTELGECTHITYNKSVVCTNAYISAHLKYIYDPQNPKTHPWNKFDAIIVDEVHSLITDASYQSATFGVLAMIKEYLRLYKSNQLQECACKHLILMSGTPQPFDFLADLNFPEDQTNTMELFDICENVIPKNVIIVDQMTANAKVGDLVALGERVIYFTNHTLTEHQAREKFNLPDTVSVGVTFSNEDKRRRLAKQDQDKISDIDKSLSEKSLIPDYINLLVTTSRNKEGINIHNKDVYNMFVETHLMYDAIQMAGRVRSGVENLYIVSNAEQFGRENGLTDILFSKKIIVASENGPQSNDEANKYLISEYLNRLESGEWTHEEYLKKTRIFADYIENRFAYVRYNMFKQKFEFFSQKEKAEELNKTQITAFEEMLLSDNNRFVKEWFPHSKICREISLRERAAKHLSHIIGKEHFVRLTKDELRTHLSVVRKLLNTNLTSPNPILHLVDEKFNCIESGGKYILYYGAEDPRSKKKSMKRRRTR